MTANDFVSTEGSIDVEAFLKANKLKKLIPKFLEDEIEIEELLELGNNPSELELSILSHDRLLKLKTCLIDFN